MNRVSRTSLLIAANIWCWGCLIVISLFALIAAPLWLAAGRSRGWSWARGVREGTWFYGRFYLAVIRPFVRIEVVNPDLIVECSSAVIAVNHQSWLDPYLMAAQKARNICFLIRGWPFKRLFFFGPLMRLAGYVASEGADADEILRQCRWEIETGASILGFPEGTRSRDGSLGRFHSGIFKLAMELDRPVIPVIVQHSGRVMAKGSFIFHPGRIKITLEPPVVPGRFADGPIPHGSLRRFVRQRFQSALSQN